MHRALLALVVASAYATSACVVHTGNTVRDPETFLRTNQSAVVRMISNRGEETTWLPVAALVVKQGSACLRSREPAWANVDAIRISHVTDENIAALLAGLPRAIRVAHLGDGEIELETAGADLTPWLTAAWHDPEDVGRVRYRVKAWHAWGGALTWSELAAAGQPLIGWPLAGATVERRKVNVPGTIAGSLGAAALIAVVVVGSVIVSLAGSVHDAQPSDGPRRKSGFRMFAEKAPDLAIHGILVAAASETPPPPGTWAPRPCTPPVTVRERRAAVAGAPPRTFQMPVRIARDPLAMHRFRWRRLRSIPVPARMIVVGPEGVCLRTKRHLVEHWEAIRIAGIDPRVVDRLVQPVEDITVTEVAGAWEIRGDRESLARWLAWHARAVQEVRRTFVDLTSIAYRVRTRHGWVASDEAAVAGALGARSWDELPPSALVGWRWSEIDRVDTERGTAPSDEDLDRHDALVADALANGGRAAPLSPGACPLTDAVLPLIPRR